MTADYSYEISYGKARVPLYRVYATPLSGVIRISESSFTGRDNMLFAMEIDVEVFGNNFLPAYLSGDNANVVATDSMKNFILRQALAYEGSTLEGFLDLLGRQFLGTYPQMERLRVTGRELPLKVTGSSFTHFVRDAYTTLPERVDRPLFIYLDMFWKYTDIVDMLAPDLARYAAAEQVRDVVQVVFHEFVSESIQHLVHKMGLRLLERFPQIAEVSFDAQNRTRDPVAVSETDPKLKVYSDPFPAYGMIKLTMSRKQGG